MRLLVGLAALLLALMALPAAGQSPARQLRLPLVGRESTPTPAAVRIQYRAWARDHGWLPWQEEGGMAGLHAVDLRAIEMRVASGPPGVGIRYRVHERHHGWQGYLADGATAGNVEGTVLEALQVGLTNAPPNTFISVEPYI